jgi:hypothetical protein
MMTTNRSLWIFLFLGMLALSALGCATGGGTAKAIGPNDLPTLAGKWVGSVTPPSGRPIPGTMDLSPAGDYVVRTGAFSAQGKAQAKDGGLQLVSTFTTGGLSTGQRTSTATLSERSDGSLVLRGNGHSDAGPFDFEVVRQK